jgi:hypothetical protein
VNLQCQLGRGDDFHSNEDALEVVVVAVEEEGVELLFWVVDFHFFGESADVSHVNCLWG